jgi:hypothetical protein
MIGMNMLQGMNDADGETLSSTFFLILTGIWIWRSQFIFCGMVIEGEESETACK